MTTQPGVSIGDPHQRARVKNRWGSSTDTQNQVSETTLRGHLLNAVFVNLRLCNAQTKFNVADPVAIDDPVYGVPNKNFFFIFDAVRDDPDFIKEPNCRDVVTDGNQPAARRLCDDEKAFATTGLRGYRAWKRPAAKGKILFAKKPSAKSSHGCKKNWSTKKKDVPRCAYVNKKAEEAMKVSRTHTGGLFATLDMKLLGNGGNLVLEIVESRNAENNKMKLFAINQLLESGSKVRWCAHDCACQFKDAWERANLCQSSTVFIGRNISVMSRKRRRWVATAKQPEQSVEPA